VGRFFETQCSIVSPANNLTLKVVGLWSYDNCWWSFRCMLKSSKNQ